MNRSACLFLAVILLLTISVPGSAMSPAAAPTWNSTIYYYNPSTAGNLTASFVGSGTTTPPDVNQDVPANGFGQILVGSTGDFKGAAMLSANVPLAAVYKQSDAANGAYAPVLYSSFDASQAGTSGKFYVPSVIHQGYYVSKVGVQNVETEAVDLVLDFYDAATGTLKATLAPPTVDPEGSFVFEMTDTDVPGIGTSFDGSLVITATKVAGGNARVVAAVEELQSQGQRSYAFEGSGNPATTIYMPSAVCRYTTKLLTSYFAVQNAGSADATITVSYYSSAGAVLATHAAGTVKPGAKISINTCDAKVYAKMNGKFGTAVIQSTQPVVVVGKVNSNDGLATAYLGQPAGSSKVLLPYVVFNKTAAGSIALTTTQIIIMNVDTAPVSSVKVNFYYKTGGIYKFQTTTLATATIPLKKFGVISTLPKVSGAALDGNGNYLGAVEVVTTNNQRVVVLARVTQTVTGVAGITTLGEDYGGIPATP